MKLKDVDLIGLPDEKTFFPEEVSEGSSRPAVRRGYRILYPLLALLVFMALAPLTSMSWRFVTTNRETLATTQQEFQLLLASSIAGQLDSHVEGLSSRIESLASAFGAIVQAQSLSFLREELATKPVLSNMLDDNLIALQFVDDRGRAYRAIPAGLEMTPSVSRLIQTAVDSVMESRDGQTWISPPCLLGSGNEAAVVIAAPVMTRGRGVPAVLVGLVDISGVWDRILADNRTGHTIYALDADGNLFAHTDPTLVERRADLRDTEIVQRFLTGAGRRKETMLFDLLSEKGKRTSYLGSYESTRLGWGIFVQVQEHQAYAIIREMVRDTFTGSLAALAVAVLLGFAFAGKLSQPVRHLTDTARKYARGEFKARASIRAHNEIGELAETFNRMAGDIEVYITSLEAAAKENNELFLGTVRALAQAIDAKDPYTMGHSDRVSLYSVGIGVYMGLDSQAIRDIYVAALLHDVGKIGIEDAILKKPANLTPDEFEIMKQHPDKGARIMAKVEKLKNVIPGMRHHHERYGGGGYPSNLKGEDIPIAARIIHVADSFDAMTTDRPYSRAMTFEAGIRRLEEISGTQVDPGVVQAFRKAWEAGEFEAEEKKMAQKRAALDRPVSPGATAETPEEVPTGSSV